MARRKKRRRRKGISNLAMGVIVGIVTLFVGLFMITKVADITEINNTSDFYSIYTSLTTNTSTIYDVLILVIIIVALAFAIGVLRGFGKTTGTTSAV